MIRRIRPDELSSLLQLYRHFHPEQVASDSHDSRLRRIWDGILENPLFRYYGAEVDGHLVSTCTLSLIPNLNHDGKPYALIENVVTEPTHRKMGWATCVIRHALAEAWTEGCYKVMLLTGHTNEDILRFYENAGFKRGIKTGFIAFPPP